MSFFNSLTQKTYISIYIMVKWWLWSFDLWSEVRGQLVASERSNQKNNIIFGILGPKNPYFNIHHGNMMTFKYWPLIRGQRSIGGLWEVKSKKWCHFWNPWPKKPIFQYTSPQNDEFEFLTSDQRSEVIWWPLRGQNYNMLFFVCPLISDG